jgi:hypothetical protein
MLLEVVIWIKRRRISPPFSGRRAPSETFFSNMCSGALVRAIKTGFKNSFEERECDEREGIFGFQSVVEF